MARSSSNALRRLLAEIAGCQICAAELPLGPRPVLRAEASARVLIIGQAPGTRVHESGVPWDDKSGERLRQWLGVDDATFYDAKRIAIMPMGFCFPGRDANGADAPPRPECAPHWHERVLAQLPRLELTLLVGHHAQARYLGRAREKTMTETVMNWRRYVPEFLPTPHPSWRTTQWLKKNPWFETDLIPEIRRRLVSLL
jgi:uracil-DNA glycosylase